ncbi:MAG: ribonuclease R [Flammeovirgaceae bacterium]
MKFKKKKKKKSNSKGYTLKGTVDHVNKKYAFIEIDEYSEDIKVRSRYLRGAIHGDKVEIKVSHQLSKRNLEGEVIKILERKTTEFIGTVEDSKGFAFFIPKNKKVYVDFFIRKKRYDKFSKRKKYLVKVIDWGNSSKKPEAKVIKSIGNIGENETEINSIIHDFGLPTDFPSEVNEETELLNEIISEKEIKKRKDLRSLDSFTIDPDDAKDFDDALSVEKEKDCISIGIHIADVSHFFNVRTKINKEAEKRATSVYLVDRTIPMLPEKLSNNLCSLKPNVDRLTYSVIIKFDSNLSIVDYWIGRTVIHSKKRFTYDEAQESIKNKNGLFHEKLNILNDIAKNIRIKRFKSGSFNFSSNEIKFRLDKEKKPIEVFRKKRQDTHKMVEEYMLLANKLVAEKIISIEKKENKPYPFVYRIHEDPEESKIGELKNYIKQFGYTINTNEGSLANSLNGLMKEIKGKPEERSVEKFAIRSMSKAKYSTTQEKHFGLSFRHYTHFTSPIRRFPDVMVHRLLSDYMNESKPKEKTYYDIMCKHSSKMEINATKAERESIKYKQAEYMSLFIDKKFDAIISGITEWGIYAEIVETLCEGLIKISSMKDDHYIFDSEKMRITGRNSKKIFRLGQPIRVLVIDTDIEKRTIDLELT